MFHPSPVLFSASLFTFLFIFIFFLPFYTSKPLFFSFSFHLFPSPLLCTYFTFLAFLPRWYAERDRRRALKQERLDLLCDDCCGDFAWWEPAAWMGWALRLFAEALLLAFIGCYLWSFWAERQADRRKAILAERKYGALGSDDESYSSFRYTTMV